MSTALFGNDPIDRTYINGAGQTIIDCNQTSPANGVITHLEVYISPSYHNSVKAKVFRSDGLWWRYIGQSEAWDPSGGYSKRTLSTPIACLVGDYIAFYLDGSTQIDADTGGAVAYYKNSAVITDSLKSSWFSPFNLIESVRATVTYGNAGMMMLMGIGQ